MRGQVVVGSITIAVVAVESLEERVQAGARRVLTGGLRHITVDCWEFVALQRTLADKSDEEMRAGLKRNFSEILTKPGKDLAFFVGNQAARHQTFSILGAYYPDAL